MNNGFEQMAAASRPAVSELLHRTKKLITDALPDVVEVPWPSQQTIGYGLGPRKGSEHFAWIGVYTEHVALGFNYGSQLPDPHELLTGTGRLFRHVKIKTAADLENPALRALLQAAIQDIKARQEVKLRLSSMNQIPFNEAVATVIG